jgi:hypothetical protein
VPSWSQLLFEGVDMKLILSAIVFLFVNTSSAFAGDGYGSCYVENGEAHVLFCSKTSDSSSGTGYVTVFDRNGSTLHSEMIVWVGIAILGCDEVDTISVGSDAVNCTFSLSR